METRGIQIFTIPETGLYYFIVKGAGSSNMASAAIIRGEIELNYGDKLYIGIGQTSVERQIGQTQYTIQYNI
jgi:hypothetical protein